MGKIVIKDLNGVGPMVYKVDNLHFHSRAEHKIDGIQYDHEFHIVHALESKQNGLPVPKDRKGSKEPY